MDISHSLHIYPAVRAVLPLALGIAVGNGLWPLDAVTDSTMFCGVAASWLYAGLLLLFCVLVLLFRRRDIWSSPRRFGVVSVFFFFLLGLMRFALQREAVSSNWPQSPVMAKGVIHDVPRRSGQTSLCEVWMYACSETADEWLPIAKCVQLRLVCPADSCTLAPGDFLNFRATFEVPANRGNPDEFDYRSYLLRNGVTATAFVPEGQWAVVQPSADECKIIPFWTRLRIQALQVRSRLLDVYAESGLQGDELAIVSALTLGDKTALSATLRQTYADAGVSHILALSGLHLGILVAILQLLFLRWLRYRRLYILACLAVIAMIWGYALLAGLPASLVRASLMYTLMLLGGMAGRSVFSLQNLALSALVMLFFHPFYLFDVGFQLSFAAMLGILLLSGPLVALCPFRRNVLRGLWQMLAVGLSAQCATSPLVAYYFHTFSPYASLVTLFLSPFTLFLVGGSPVLILLCYIGWPYAWLAEGVTAVVRWQNTLLTEVVTWPGALWTGLYPSLPTVMLCFAFIGLTAVWAFSRAHVWARMLLTCVILLMASMIYSEHGRYADTPCLWFYNNPRQPVVHLICSPDESYLLTPLSDSADVRDTPLKRSWEGRLRSVPTVVTDSLFYPSVAFRKGILFAPEVRLAQISDTLWWKARSPHPIDVDYLHVCRGFRGKLQVLSPIFRPSLVVLDASLSVRRSQTYAEECRVLGWPVYDMRTRGALKVAFKWRESR